MRAALRATGVVGALRATGVAGAPLFLASAVAATAAYAQTTQPPPGEAPAAAQPPPMVPPPEKAPSPEKEAATASPSWFARPPLTVSVGASDQKWQLTVYGFIEADVINDSTRSYGDSIGSTLVARDEVYEGQNGRTQFSIRNTRLGFALESPVYAGLKPSAVLEADFFGNQPGKPPSTSESAYFDNPAFRIRHAYLKLEDDYVDVWVGQTYYLFGWQNYFFPCSLEFLPLPNEAFGRTTQVRLAHTFKLGLANIDIAAAALRPAQRDSEIPDGNAGIRLSFNGWKGISTPGNGGTAAFPLAVGVSGAVRPFKVDAFTPPPTESSNHATGWGVSFDGLVPLIPARDSEDRGNRLTLTASFVIGSGIADLINTGGGVSFPVLPNPAMINPPPTYTPDIDNGLVTFDNSGRLHTIDWQSAMVGVQYYVPPSGRVILSANYTQSLSQNITELYPRGGAEIMLFSRVAKRSRYADANIFFDATPAVRVGASFHYTTTEYVDGAMPRNLRWMGQALYFF